MITMRYGKKIYLSFMWIVLGLVLTLCCAAGILKNDMWQGIAYGWIACGVVQVIKQLRYRTNSEYRQSVDIAADDERNRFISSRAWSWAGYGFVLIAGIADIVSLIVGQKAVALMICYGICLIISLYWISYLILKRKY